MEAVYEQACIQEKVKSIFCSHHLNDAKLQVLADSSGIQKYKADDIILSKDKKQFSFSLF